MTRKAYRLTILIAASGCLVGIISCLLSQIVVRTVFSSGLYWTGELARFLAVWAALLGAAAARDAGQLHVVDALLTRLPEKVAHLVIRLRAAMAIAVLLILIYAGIAMSDRALPQVSSAMQISMAWVYSALPVTASLMLVSELFELRSPRPSTPP